MRKTLVILLLCVCSLASWAQKREHINPEDRKVMMDSPTYVPMVKVGKALVDGDSIQYMEMNNVYVYPQPVVNITATETQICTDGQVTLTANLNDYNADNIIFKN